MVDSEENYKFDLGSVNLSQNFVCKWFETCGNM